MILGRATHDAENSAATVLSLLAHWRWSEMIAVLGGTALLMQSLWAGLIVVAFFLLIRQQFVLKEEMLLTATFGSSYTEWQKRVRRWI